MTAVRIDTSRARSALARSRHLLAAERGDTMIEVVVAALLVALIAAGVLTGFGQVSTLSGQQRQRAQATALAQQDQARLRGLAISQISGSAGNQTGSTALDGTTYTVTSKSTYVTGTGNSTCTPGQSGTTADEVAISSSVSWPNMGNRPPVVVHSVVSPPVGGAVVVSATTPPATGATGSTFAGLAGMGVSLSGPSTTSPIVTDSSGCAIFAGLTAGAYTLALTPPTGYVDKDGNTTIANQAVNVTATQTQYVTQPTIPTMAQPGTITASFSTMYSTGASGATGATGATTFAGESDQFYIQNPGLSQGLRYFGTDSTATNSAYAATVTSGPTVYPSATPLSGTNDAYSVAAGGCEVNGIPTAGQVPVVVASGQTATPTLPEPALIIMPYLGGSTTNITPIDDPAGSAVSYSGSGWSHLTNVTGDYQKTESDDTNTNTTDSVTFSFTGNTVKLIGTTNSSEGEANVSIDGLAPTLVDFYSSSKVQGATLYDSSVSDPGLTQGPHTLTVTATHQKRAANRFGSGGSSGYTIIVDELTGTTQTPNSLMTTKPNVVLTSTDCSNSDYPPTQIPTATNGGALQFPGIPWGNYTVCVDNGTGGGAVHDKVTVPASSLIYTSGLTVEFDLFSGGAGTYGTGPCQTNPNY